MYYSHFGLTEAPFSIAPNPAYLFMTDRHQEALAHLYHGIESDAGFVLLTGDIGTGKTTVCRRFLHHLPQHTQVAFILNPRVDRIELLQAIAKELNIPASNSETANLRQLTDNLHDYLLNNHAKGINTVLLVDEAQQIHPPVLEFIRLLTNLETDKQKLLKIILVGQPELNDLLAQPAMVQLSQRITARYHVYPLTINEINHYINHRLQVAGYTQERPLFSSRRIKQLFTMTKGVPRLINVICDRALLGAYSQGATTVDAKVLANAHKEVSGNYSSPLSNTNVKWPRPMNLLVSVFCIVLIAIFSVLWLPKIIPRSLLLLDSAQCVNSTNITDVSDSSTAVPVVTRNENVAIHDVVDAIDSINTRNKLSDKPAATLSTTLEASSERSVVTIDNATDNVVMVESEIVSAPIKKEPEPVPVVSYYEDKQDALAALIQHAIPQSLPTKKHYQQECDRLHLLLFRCETVNEPSWQALQKYNRPAVITLRDNGLLSHVVVVGITNDYVLVMAEPLEGQPQKKQPIFLRLPISEIVTQWQGELTFIWQAPLGFTDVIFRESNPVLIDWLAKAFATIDQKVDVLAKGKYNSLLEKRIRLFQKKYVLSEDGKAGVETLLKLNEMLGIAVLLDSTAVDQ
jgi:general secretion pathway protein A